MQLTYSRMRGDTKKILGQYNFEVYEVQKGTEFYNALKTAAVGLWEGYKSEYPAEIMDRILKDFSL